VIEAAAGLLLGLLFLTLFLERLLRGPSSTAASVSADLSRVLLSSA